MRKMLNVKPGGKLGLRRPIGSELIVDRSASVQLADKQEDPRKQQTAQRVDDLQRIAGIGYPAKKSIPIAPIMPDGARKGFQ